MAQYKILTIQDTPTSTGKSKKTATIEGDARKFGIWSDFPNYANLVSGMIIEADIKTSPDGKWYNLVPAATGTKSYGAYKKPQANIEKVMEKKEASIGKFQDNKELGIKISSTMRMAVDCALAEFNIAHGNANLDTLILKWRKWLWENWDAKETDFAPFPSNPRTPDMRVDEQDRNITPEQITFDQNPDNIEKEWNNYN